MSLVVGTDSYISKADADAYVALRYMSTEAKRVAWAALPEADCEVLLRRAASIIDQQPLAGVKVTEAQTMEFPRALYTEYVGDDNILSPQIMTNENWHVQTSVPTAVLAAQIELALQYTVGTPDRIEFQRQGVKSFSVGKLSETYAGTRSSLVSIEARDLLAPYVLGSVRIC